MITVNYANAAAAANAGVPLYDILCELHKLAQKDSSLSRLERHLAADYGEHVLHIYEAAYPDDMRPRDAIQAARDYADGKIDARALAAAREAAFSAGYDADANAAATAAAKAAYYAYTATPNASATASAARDAERAWQLKRLLERLEESE